LVGVQAIETERILEASAHFLARLRTTLDRLVGKSKFVSYLGTFVETSGHWIL